MSACAADGGANTAPAEARPHTMTALSPRFYYEGCVRCGLHAFKFRRDPRRAEAFGSEMAHSVVERYPAVDFDIIVSVPMTKRSLRDRGYDQCALLAQRLADETGVPYKPGAIVKNI